MKTTFSPKHGKHTPAHPQGVKAPPAAPVSILLDPEQTEVLGDLGECFAVVHTAACTGWPSVNGRVLLTLVPCTIAQANQAIGTITGTHRATKIRKAKATP